MESAAERWRRAARTARRRAERRRARLRLEQYTTGDRARAFAAAAGIADRSDPFLRRVLAVVGRRTTVVDVGAGSGRYAIAIAPLAREVVAVDPSADLLGMLVDEIRRRRLANVGAVHARWEDAERIEADVAVCYGVMGHVDDAERFFRKLDAAARRRVFVGMGTGVDEIRGPLWRHFHDEDPPSWPDHLSAVAVLWELGIEPEVEIDENRSGSYRDVREAVGVYRELLQLPATPAIDRELERVLRTWLRQAGDGRWRPPIRSSSWATLSWRPRAASAT